MSENVTHTAIVDDCARLALAEPAICEAFKIVLLQHLDMARLGGVTRHGDRHNPGLLESIRKRWPGRAAGDGLERKLAFVLGWMSHRAADRQMKPVFRAADPGCPWSPTECSIYHDATVLREVYQGGEREPYRPGLFDPATGGVAEVERLLQAMWQRMLIGMHTFIPDDEDVESWLDKVAARSQRLTVDLARYAQALAAPDADLTRRFVTEPSFYDRRDPIIERARQLQHDRPAEAPPLAPALAAASGQSLYARALARAYRYTDAANAFFERRIDRETLCARLEIGRPELAG